MKSFKKFVAEVAQPKPEEEKRFKDMHSYEVVPHPVAEPEQHTGEIGKPKAKRLADQEGEANYDKAIKNPEKRMAVESVEQIDEISKELAARYLKKAPAKAADAGDKIARASDAYDRETADKRRKKGIRDFLNTHKGVERATNRLMKKEAVDTDEELSPKQKKLDHNKNGKIDGHDLAMIRSKKKNEEVEHLDEISQETLRNYHGKAGADLQAKRAKVAKGELSTADLKKGQNRVKGLNRAANKMEEVEVTETTSSAIKKPVTMTGPDGKTRTVMKKANADRTDDRGQDKIATKESANLEEAVKVKRGPIRLKDGSQVMVSKEDADLLTQMFKDLSPRNQREMEKVMMTDKAGFEEIRGFAREAL